MFFLLKAAKKKASKTQQQYLPQEPRKKQKIENPDMKGETDEKIDEEKIAEVEEVQEEDKHQEEKDEEKKDEERAEGEKKEKRGEEREEGEKKERKKHFILIHGAGHGGWSWYKLHTLLTSAGHRVTAVDLAGCGVNPSQLSEISSFEEYVRPLMDAMASIPAEEKVIAVGHCWGGFALSLAMERFPNRFSAAVFIAALMPKHWSPPAATLDEFLQRDHINSLLDCQFQFDQEREDPLTSFTYGAQFMASTMYQNSPFEDVTLAQLLVRPSGLYLEDISNETMLSEENYGSINRVYIICKQDKLYSVDFQRWVIENNPPKEVKEIEDSDHMVMFSKPKELCKCLLEIAETYS